MEFEIKSKRNRIKDKDNAENLQRASDIMNGKVKHGMVIIAQVPDNYEYLVAGNNVVSVQSTAYMQNIPKVVAISAFIEACQLVPEDISNLVTMIQATKRT